jgi:DNA-binding MarR family transcriptional regulator
MHGSSGSQDNMVDQPGDKRLLQAMELLYFGYRSFTAGPDRVLQEKGLGRVHHRILYFVGRNPRININELLSILQVSKQALNAPLRKLIQQGLIEVQTGEHDRRVKELQLSKTGAKLEAKLTQIQMQHLSRAFDMAGPAALEGWEQIMRELPRGQTTF